MNAGVSKSGSPAPKPTTSTPAFFIALALALTARVIDSETRLIRSARGNMGRFLGCLRHVKCGGEQYRRGQTAASATARTVIGARSLERRTSGVGDAK